MENDSFYQCGSCGYCLDTCAVYGATYREALSPRGKCVLLRKELEILNSESVTEQLYTCTLCGRCEDVCPSKIKIVDIVQTWRNSHPFKNAVLDSAIASVFEKGNPYNEMQPQREKWLQGLGTDPDADTAYFPGCTTSLLQPQIAHQFITFVQDRLPLQVIDDVCCGSVLAKTGFLIKAQQIMERNIEYFKNRGIKTLITSCAGCYSHFLEYPSIKVLHASQVLIRYVDELEPQSFLTTYHDPCHLVRNSVTSEPRHILKTLSMYNEKESQSCCGAGGGMLLNFRDIADFICSQMLKDSHPDVTMVTACPFCLYHMKRNSFHKMISLEEFVTSCI